MNSLISIFKEVIYLSATASILLSLILIIKKVFNKTLTPKGHYYIWILLLIRLAIPFSPESPISIYTLFYEAAEKVNLPASEINISFQNASIVLPPTATPNNSENKTDSINPNSTTASASNARDNIKYNPILVSVAFIWIIGVLVLSFYTLYLNLAFTANVRKNYNLSNDERINSILKYCKNTMNIKCNIPLLTSQKVRTPSLYGFFNSKILISETYMKQLSDSEVRYIFLHELSHYKRKDIAINWIITILQIIYFFNPLIWYAFYKIHEDCEISCDAAALKYINELEYKSYGSTIIKLIKLFSESNFIPVTAGISKNKSSYKRRIIMISKFKKGKWTSTLLAIILIISVGLIGLTGCKASPEKASDINKPVSSNTSNNTENKPTSNNTSDKNNPVSVNNPSNTDNKPASNNQNTNQLNNQNNTNIPKESENSLQPVLKPTEAFYGQWVIKQVLAFGQVGTYSNENTKTLIEKTLSFSQDKASYFGDQPSDISKVATSPVYKKTVISKGDFLTNYRMTFDKLGIKADSITQVTVSDSKGTVSTFLVKDDNTLIIIGGGTYFELVKKTA
jgi:bla regulator protein BlaR1